VTAVLLLAAALVGGDVAPVQPGAGLSLAAAVATARDTSPALSAARHRAAAAAEQARAASRLWIPALTLDSSWDRTDVPARAFAQKLNRGAFTSNDFALGRLNDPGFDANLETTVGLGLAVDVFGSRRAQARSEAARARAQVARARAVEADVALETTRVYLALLSTARAVAAAEKSLRAAFAMEETVSAQRDAGSALDADVLRVRSRRRQREVGLARERSEEALETSRLRLLLGWTPDRAISLSSPAGPEIPALSLEQWTSRALAASPELEAADAAAEGPREDSRRERRASWPAIDAGAAYQDDRSSLSNGRGAATFQVRLHWDVWDAGRRPRLAASNAAADAAAADRRAVEDAVRLAVESSWRDLEVARMEAEAASAGRREADEVYRVVGQRWQAGKAALVDVLDAESAQSSAAADEARIAARVGIAAATLQRAAGGI